MPLLGSGMLMTFTEVPDEHEQDFNEWYNREHTDERTQLPGFLRSRRYVACEGTTSPKYMAWYETRAVADLAAPGYLALLADQTDWSKRVMGRFSLFQRLTLQVSVDQIFGFGGALSLVRLTAPAPLVAQGQPIPTNQMVEWVLALEGGESAVVSAAANAVADELDGATALHYRFLFGTSR